MNTLDVNSTDYQNKSKSILFIDSVDECPVCLRKAKMHYLSYKHQVPSHAKESKFWVVYQCPNSACQSVFVSKFIWQARTPPNPSIYVFESSTPITYKRIDFHKEINLISKDFSNIFNEAYIAEQAGLKLICGPGYRKALEFLIKDYCINKFPDQTERIKSILLGKVISEFIDDKRIKHAATRATWLGNDETHYTRKWSDKDLEDLKNLIRLTVIFIESESILAHYSSEMANGKN